MSNYWVMILAFVFLVGCANVEKNNDVELTTEKNALVEADLAEQKTEDLLKKQSREDSTYAKMWCSEVIVKQVADNLERLEPSLIASFLATFHESCQANAAFSEQVNSLLIKVLKKDTQTVLILFQKNKSLRKDLILDIFKKNMPNETDRTELIATIEKVNAPKQIKAAFLHTLK